MGLIKVEPKQDSDQEVEADHQEKKYPYPKQVFFIIGNEFCERFSYYGMKTVLVIYFKSKLHYTEDTSTVIYHTFSLFCYFTPILGALIADQFLGKFKTIIYISVIYILGHLLKTLAAITPLGLPPAELSLIGLALIALGTGGIKPCVAAFGGDQFMLPEQARQLQTFFSIFYFAINIGALASTVATPILRQDVKCFGDDTCYSLAFGVPAILMFIATIILIIGKPFYTFKPPQGNVLTQVCKITWHGIWNKIKPGPKEKHDHWLDASKEKYNVSLIEDTKILLRVLLLFIPLPVFWALFDQQGSRWTFQATRMNGKLGSYTIKPDQMQVMNAAFILVLIPTFDWIVYPLFAKVNLLVKPLHRITVGGLLAALAFLVSAFVELKLEGTYEKIPENGTCHIHLMNTLNCQMMGTLKSVQYNQDFHLNQSLNHILYDLKPGRFELNMTSKCIELNGQQNLSFEVMDATVKGIFVLPLGDKGFRLYEGEMAEQPKKNESTFPKIRVLFDLGSSLNQNETLILKRKDSDDKPISLNSTLVNDKNAESDYIVVEPDYYGLFYDEESSQEIGAFEFLQGGVYTMAVTKKPTLQVTVFKLTEENSLHMLWLIPQYFIITIGEILFSITGLEFSYSKAPTSMKSVVQAAWLLTVAFGNLIVIIVAEAKSKSLSQAVEFFMFSALMLVDMGIFAGLAFLFQRQESKNETEGIDNPAAESVSMEEKTSNKMD